jgi:hypothetical protein
MIPLFLLQLLRREEIDNRPFDEFKSKYESLYIPALTNSRDAWTATDSSNPCDHGIHSSVDRTDTRNRLRYFRWLVGIPWEVSIDSSYDEIQADAAAYMQANNELTHSPSSSGQCYTANAYNGASHSNIAWSSAALTSANSITMYMDDSGVDSLGHRRWILNYGTTAFGLWQTRNYGALRVFGVPGSSARMLSLKSVGSVGPLGEPPELNETGGDVGRRLMDESVAFVAYPPGGPSLLSQAKVVWSFQKSQINSIESVEIERSDGLNIEATGTILGGGYHGFAMAKIVLSSVSQIVSGYRYRVRVRADGETFEWYPYFVSYSSSSGWTGTSPIEFSDDDSGGDDSGGGDSGGGVSVVAIVVPITIIVIVGVGIAIVAVLWRMKMKMKESENAKNPMAIPVLNP